MSSVPACPLILVVEDDETAREGVAVVLLHEGYEVALAGDGQQALDLLRDGLRPDLILLAMLDGWGCSDGEGKLFSGEICSRTRASRWRAA